MYSSTVMSFNSREKSPLSHILLYMFSIYIPPSFISCRALGCLAGILEKKKKRGDRLIFNNFVLNDRLKREKEKKHCIVYYVFPHIDCIRRRDDGRVSRVYTCVLIF